MNKYYDINNLIEYGELLYEVIIQPRGYHFQQSLKKEDKVDDEKNIKKTLY